jgi:hypothetical protein
LRVAISEGVNHGFDDCARSERRASFATIDVGSRLAKLCAKGVLTRNDRGLELPYERRGGGLSTFGKAVFGGRPDCNVTRAQSEGQSDKLALRESAILEDR